LSKKKANQPNPGPNSSAIMSIMEKPTKLIGSMALERPQINFSSLHGTLMALEQSLLKKISRNIFKNQNQTSSALTKQKLVKKHGKREP
jgi:hypothetical protein